MTLDVQPVTRFETAKAWALLAHLALEAGRPHPRDLLAELPWPDRPAAAGQFALARDLIAGLAQAIPGQAFRDNFLQAACRLLQPPPVSPPVCTKTPIPS